MATTDFDLKYQRAHPLTQVLQGCPELLRGRSERHALGLLGRPTDAVAGGYRSWDVGVPGDLQSDWPPFELRVSGGRVVHGSGWGLPEVG